MVNNAWASTWPRKTLLAADIKPTAWSVKAMMLWHKSTPIDPWSVNPLGIPARGYTKRNVPHTDYAMFLSYGEFAKAFAKFIATRKGIGVRAILISGESIPSLWKELHSLDWPAAATENDFPREIHTWIGEQLRESYGVPKATPHRTSGTTDSARLNNHKVVEAHRAMVTATQAQMDLKKAIEYITKGVK